MSQLKRKYKPSLWWLAVAPVVFLLGVGGAAYAQPWGLTLDSESLWNHVERGSISSVWLTEGGAEGAGRATMGAVVACMLSILVADYILAAVLFQILFA